MAGSLALAIVANSIQAQKRPEVERALGEWLTSYRKGEVDMSPRRDITPESMAIALGLLAPGREKITSARELEALVAGCVQRDTRAAAKLVLAVAAVGMDRRKYTATMLPTRVRTIGERGLLGFESNSARDYLMRAARGDEKLSGDKNRVMATRAAALRALASYREAVFRPTIENALSGADSRLRLAAAEGLTRIRAVSSLKPLLAAMSAEQNGAALQGIATAVHTILRTHHQSIWPPYFTRAVREASAALDRTNWRADMALINVIEECRLPEGILPLIEVLKRFAKSGAKQSTNGTATQSTLLLHRAHHALVRLTGRAYASNRPTEWKYFWNRSNRSLDVPVNPPPPDESDLPKFFGLPVQGNRVLFAIDLSGSMEFGYRGQTTRLEIATGALMDAVRELPKATRFDIVCFSDGAWAWRDGLELATERNKDEAVEFIRDMDADGGTNTWGALSEILRLHARKYGETNNYTVDEVFLLSDGMPTVGHVIDAQAILQMTDAGNAFDDIRINTVFLAPRLTERDEENERAMGMRARDFMAQLASRNGGRFSEQN